MPAPCRCKKESPIASVTEGLPWLRTSPAARQVVESYRGESTGILPTSRAGYGSEFLDAVVVAVADIDVPGGVHSDARSGNKLAVPLKAIGSRYGFALFALFPWLYMPSSSVRSSFSFSR